MTQLERGSAAQLVLAYVARHTAELRWQEARLRADDPAAVHQLRVAARRLRSAVKTYAPLFEPGATDRVGDELRWLGRTLSEARDAQVLRERLRLMVTLEPPDLVRPRVMDRIDDELRRAQRAGHEQALVTLDGERYRRVLDALDAIVRSAPLVPEADRPARQVLPGLLQRDLRRLRRAEREVASSQSPLEHDVALHTVRKKAKRLRYAAESSVPALGERARELSASAARIQRALGEHHDAVVSRARLREYGARVYVDEENGFVFGRLHAIEQSRADQAERDYETARTALPSGNLRRWART